MTPSRLPLQLAQNFQITAYMGDSPLILLQYKGNPADKPRYRVNILGDREAVELKDLLIEYCKHLDKEE